VRGDKQVGGGFEDAASLAGQLRAIADEQPRATPAFRLIYRSHSLILPLHRTTEHAEIFRVSRLNNVAAQVTGALLLYRDVVCQALEGEEDVVRRLFSRILQDPRHHAVEVVDTATVESLSFPRWAMAMISEEDSADVRLVASRNGMTISARNGTTAAQDRLLVLMRALALDLDRDS